MGRYRGDQDDERDYYQQEERFRREALGSYDEPFSRRPRFDDDRRFDNERRFESERGSEYGRGRYGERADYQSGEPRYTNTSERGEDNDRFRDQGRRSSLYDIRGDLSTGRQRDQYASDRSRLRCRDIMTTDLAVAQRATPLTQVALMMKQEDTGVIPVVEYDVMAGNGRANEADPDRDREERRHEGRNYSRGKLVGLITDRDIVVRAIAEGKECTTTRAEDIMSVDIHSARPNDRVVDITRIMADKQVRRIPVVNENSYLLGMISMADIASEISDDRELGEALEEISKSTSFWNRVFG